MADLKELITEGVLKNYEIDLVLGMLVKKSDTEEVPKKKADGGINRKSKPIVIVCPNCGATNSIEPGKKAVCEYCDSPLKIE